MRSSSARVSSVSFAAMPSSAMRWRSRDCRSRSSRSRLCAAVIGGHLSGTSPAMIANIVTSWRYSPQAPAIRRGPARHARFDGARRDRTGTDIRGSPGRRVRRRAGAASGDGIRAGQHGRTASNAGPPPRSTGAAPPASASDSAPHGSASRVPSARECAPAPPWLRRPRERTRREYQRRPDVVAPRVVRALLHEPDVAGIVHLHHR